LHPGWTVLVTGDKIAAAGPASEVTAPAEARTIDLPQTLIPGMIEGHSISSSPLQRDVVERSGKQ
jgi:imidazolonepropionase-like amidohydrolase